MTDWLTTVAANSTTAFIGISISILCIIFFLPFDWTAYKLLPSEDSKLKYLVFNSKFTNHEHLTHNLFRLFALGLERYSHISVQSLSWQSENGVLWRILFLKYVSLFTVGGLIMEFDKDTTERLLDAMLFCPGPYIQNDDFRDEQPWLFELAESYNEIVAQLPVHWRLYRYELLRF